MKRIQIFRNRHLDHGELYYDEIETITTNRPLNLSIITKWNNDGTKEKVIYLQIGNMFNADFQEIDISEKDMIYIK